MATSHEDDTQGSKQDAVNEDEKMDRSKKVRHGVEAANAVVKLDRNVKRKLSKERIANSKENLTKLEMGKLHKKKEWNSMNASAVIIVRKSFQLMTEQKYTIDTTN